MTTLTKKQINENKGYISEDKIMRFKLCFESFFDKDFVNKFYMAFCDESEIEQHKKIIRIIKAVSKDHSVLDAYYYRFIGTIFGKTGELPTVIEREYKFGPYRYLNLVYKILMEEIN